VHCSRVFRSSAPSEPLPSSPGGRLGRRTTVDAVALDQWNGGSAPVRRATSTVLPGRADLEGMLPGPVRSQGRVARAQRAATRLESAWEQWRALHGLAVAPWQPVVSYVGYSPDQVRDTATELAGWNPGELPGQVTDRLAAWPPGPQTGADQPPASA
jgi:hypothetical protein